MKKNRVRYFCFRFFLRCRKSILSLAFFISGFLALIWFLIRVIPKPSRAAYPCQRAAFPLASSFVLYVAGMLAAWAKWVSAGRFLQHHHWLEGGLLVGLAGLIVFLTLGVDPQSNQAAFVAVDGPNQPIGTAEGLFPGRVVWVHDPNATTWDGVGYVWWDDQHTNPAVVESMLSRAICWLTGKQDDRSAWDALFRYHNSKRGKGNIGYSPGERIVIKPNHNNQWSHQSRYNFPDTPPAVYTALLKQLVYQAGVDPSCITISEPSRYIDDKTYNACVSLFPQVRFEETNYFKPENNPGTEGRTKADPVPGQIVWSSNNPHTGQPIADYPLARSFFEADYVINLARMQGHAFAGVTLCAKNWYGCFGVSPEYDSTIHSGNALHSLVTEPSYAGYSPLVDLMGHRHLGQKTVLYILDALWGFEYNHIGLPAPYAIPPFNGDYPSSLLVSQDPVALDSVALDFLAAQFNLPDIPIDSYLHEAALADNPPSGVFYDPEGDGTRLGSLGVHEHWNNPLDKRYSRNLGTGPGIELLCIHTAVYPSPPCTALPADLNQDCIVDLLDLLRMTSAWGSVPGTPGWDFACDIAPPGGDGQINQMDFSLLSGFWMQRFCTQANPCDFSKDCSVNIKDFVLFTDAWLSVREDSRWNASCDTAPTGGDGLINQRDFALFSSNWLWIGD
ncbi:MAG: DUF362 domain-containing protein [Anaerohalosphaeraceae bacterium]